MHIILAYGYIGVSSLTLDILRPFALHTKKYYGTISQIATDILCYYQSAIKCILKTFKRLRGLFPLQIIQGSDFLSEIGGHPARKLLFYMQKIPSKKCKFHV